MFLFKVYLNYAQFSMSIIPKLKHLASVLILKISVLNTVYYSLNPIIRFIPYCSFSTKLGPYAVYFVLRSFFWAQFLYGPHWNSAAIKLQLIDFLSCCLCRKSELNSYLVKCLAIHRLIFAMDNRYSLNSDVPVAHT